MTDISDGEARPTDPVCQPLVVVMGVAGCGKSGIGSKLAKAIDAGFIEGDALQPPENVARMSRGEPLTDELRAGWLDAVGAALRAAADQGEGAVAACSALKRIYRDRLRQAAGSVIFIHLSLSPEASRKRVAARKNHFMPASLVDSQFAALEVPGPDENAISIDSEQPMSKVIAQARRFVRKVVSQPTE